MRKDTPTSAGRPRSNVSPEDRTLILVELSKLGWPAVELDHAIAFESAWRTDAHNRTSDASGLIQLMPAWFARHNFRADLTSGRERAAAFRQISALEQLPWLQQYFREVTRPWRVPGDTYMVFAAPSYVGAPDETVIFQVGTKAWQQNPAWRTTPLGPITAGSIRRVILRRMKGSPNV